MENQVSLFRLNSDTKVLTPFFSYGTQAGFPSPAADYLESDIDLNQALIKNPSSTFIARVRGTSMIGIGIYDGSLAIIDRSLNVGHGNLVLAWIDDGFTIKKLSVEGGKMTLISFNPKFKPIVMDESQRDCIWGKVTYIINPAP